MYDDCTYVTIAAYYIYLICDACKPIQSYYRAVGSTPHIIPLHTAYRVRTPAHRVRWPPQHARVQVHSEGVLPAQSARRVATPMSWFTAAAAVALTVAAVAGVVRRADDGAADASAAAYTLNGQNVEWPCASTKNVYADTGRYVAKNVIGTRVQVWGDRAFVLTPRFRPGVPFTVSAVRLDCADRCWPALAPYPCWSQHDESDPNAVQNAVDMYLDPTGVLWVLDSGLVNTMEQPVRRTQPRIFAVDVKTDKVRRVTAICASDTLLLYI